VPNLIDNRAVRFLNGRSHPVDNPIHPVLEQRYQQVIFVFEVKVNGAVGDVRVVGDIRDLGVVETLFCEGSQCGVEDTLSFIGFLGRIGHGFLT
jgi:hypothetical protein